MIDIRAVDDSDLEGITAIDVSESGEHVSQTQSQSRPTVHLNRRTGTGNASKSKWDLPFSLLRTGVISAETLMQKSLLTVEQQRYVREQLYPWDTALHALWCG